MPTWVVLASTCAAAVLALVVGWKGVVRSREGRMLAFVALFLLPVVMTAFGFSQHMERAQSREFCVSCHVMQDYGRSLMVDDPSYIPAKHFQNNLVPREEACYACHTNYTMFGTLTAKMKGVQHLMVQYFGTIPAPKDIKLYEPYSNRECLHCHEGQRKFEESSQHRKTPELMGQIHSGQRSCVSAGCHEFVHDVGELNGMPMWKGAHQ